VEREYASLKLGTDGREAAGWIEVNDGRKRKIESEIKDKKSK
jgi:hypothetical protein